MAEPKPYSHTDTDEQESLAVLLGLINSKFVKADIRIRDTHPNVDGTIDIVDQNQVLVGRLEVQLRKIGSDDRKDVCSTALVAYSERSTLPVILICVDIVKKRAFWKHLTPTMPEYKKDQETFTVHFSETSDAIDDKCVYLQKWTEIIRDYQESIKQYPILRTKATKNLTLEGIAPRDIERFQRFIDTVNSLLENDFISLKASLFPSVWKLGVGVVSSDEWGYCYNIYRIPYGSEAPFLVCKSDRGFFSKTYDPNMIVEYSVSRQNLADPQKAGREFVLGEVNKVVERKALPIYGKMIASDVLISFIDRYYRCLGLKPELERYTVADLDYALNRYLFGVCAAWFPEDIRKEGGVLYIDLDSLLQFLMHKEIKPIPLTDALRFHIVARWFPLRAAFGSLRYLLANEIKSIDRIFAKRSESLSPKHHYIWSGYSRDDEISSITRILSNSLQEYSAFVIGNRLQFPRSPYLNKDISIIFEYEPVGTIKDYEGPGLREHHVLNPKGTLPKLAVYVREKENQPVDKSGFPLIKIQGVQYEANLSSTSWDSLLFQETPFLNLIYKMLSHDLKTHYGI